jgi:CHRD domain
MNRVTFAPIARSAAAAALLCPGVASAEYFIANLTSTQEVPAIVTPASGQFFLNYRTGAKTGTYSLNWSALRGGNATFAHIHIGQPGVNGGVAIFLCGGATAPACPAGATGTVGGTFDATDVVGPAVQGVAAGDLADVISALRDGVGYVNVHNGTYPGGAIRGEVQ